MAIKIKSNVQSNTTTTAGKAKKAKTDPKPPVKTDYSLWESRRFDPSDEAALVAYRDGAKAMHEQTISACRAIVHDVASAIVDKTITAGQSREYAFRRFADYIVPRDCPEDKDINFRKAKPSDSDRVKKALQRYQTTVSRLVNRGKVITAMDKLNFIPTQEEWGVGKLDSIYTLWASQTKGDKPTEAVKKLSKLLKDFSKKPRSAIDAVIKAAKKPTTETTTAAAAAMEGAEKKGVTTEVIGAGVKEKLPAFAVIFTMVRDGKLSLADMKQLHELLTKRIAEVSAAIKP